MPGLPFCLLPRGKRTRDRICQGLPFCLLSRGTRTRDRICQVCLSAYSPAENGQGTESARFCFLSTPPWKTDKGQNLPGSAFCLLPHGKRTGYARSAFLPIPPRKTDKGQNLPVLLSAYFPTENGQNMLDLPFFLLSVRKQVKYLQLILKTYLTPSRTVSAITAKY